MDEKRRAQREIDIRVARHAGILFPEDLVSLLKTSRTLPARSSMPKAPQAFLLLLNQAAGPHQGPNASGKTVQTPSAALPLSPAVADYRGLYRPVNVTCLRTEANLGSLRILAGGCASKPRSSRLRCDHPADKKGRRRQQYIP